MRRFWLVLAIGPFSLTAQFDKLGEQLGQLSARQPVTEIRLNADPADCRVRSLETAVIQVRAYGTSNDSTVRLRRGGARITVQQDGGWVSKPFVWQGEEKDKFFEEGASAAWNIMSEQTGRFVAKDCVLYTAPEKPGKHKIVAELEGKRAEIEIEVAADAPSRRKPETITFPAQPRGNDPYRRLAERYAPFLAQETWFQPKSDTPARFDFDGDWHGDNNWDALEEGSSQAYVYYAVVETATHWFLIYNVFHPRDYSDRCVVGTCHENDNEGIILTVRKDGSDFGRLQAMETLAHNNVYTVTADRAVRGNLHNIDGEIEFYNDTHPAVFIESGGHGIYGTRTPHSRFTLARGEFESGTGMTLVYKGVAERPRHANDRLVGYDLLPIYEEWWTKAEEGKWADRTFDGYFRYQPYGNRPALAAFIGGTFFGRKESSNKAKPFWGWHDTLTLKRKVLAVGQWALDPAYAVIQTLRFPSGQPFSVDYVYHPFLGIGAPPQAVTQAAAAAADPAPAPDPAPPAAPADTPAAAAAPNGGEVAITVRVDGAVEIELDGGVMWCETLSGQPAEEEEAVFTSPLPRTPGFAWSLTKAAGRGKAALVEQPSEANGYKAKIRIEDPRGGADLYRLRLRWSR